MPGLKINKNLIKRRTEALELASDRIARIVEDAERSLARLVYDLFTKRLITDEDGLITNSLENRRAVGFIDKAFANYQSIEGERILKSIIQGVEEMQSLSREYYTGFASVETLNEIQKDAAAQVFEMLGVKDGKLVTGGYLDTLIGDETVKVKIKNEALKGIFTKQSKTDLVTGLEAFVEGEGDKSGVLRDFHKQTSMDIVAQTDRVTSRHYADSLKLTAAIYEGSLIKTSRLFCIARVGRVFHISEIEEFNPPAKPPNYNPFVDLGGYNCRHHLNFISTELAIKLRPDIAKFYPKAA